MKESDLITHIAHRRAEASAKNTHWLAEASAKNIELLIHDEIKFRQRHGAEIALAQPPGRPPDTIDIVFSRDSYRMLGIVWRKKHQLMIDPRFQPHLFQEACAEYYGQFIREADRAQKEE